jgi:hypothetical protein
MKIELHKVTWYSWSATIIVFVLLIPLCAYIMVQYKETQKILHGGKTSMITVQKPETIFTDPMNGTYVIDGEAVTFNNGKSEQDIVPGSATKIESMIFGALTYADLNNDGRQDALFFLTQLSGGSGTFFYVAAAINTGKGYTGTNAIFLGDRIAPQTIDVSNGVAAINYAVRGADEPMSAMPSIGVTKYLQVRDTLLKEDVSSIEQTTATSSAPYINLFTSLPDSPYQVYSSNIVGYFDSGSVLFSFPRWISDHWKTKEATDTSEIIFTPQENIPTRDFSDIVIDIGTTTETYNANNLYNIDINSNLTAGETLLLSEILLNVNGDLRIYHIQQEGNGMIIDTYYFDGNKKTATVIFSANRANYTQYGAKVKEMVQGLQNGSGPQG